MANQKNLEQPSGQGAIPRQRTERHVEVWANDMQSSFTPWDFSLSFGFINGVSSEKLVIDEAVTVHLSPQFLIRVIQTIQVNIEKYEQRFGKIQMPRGLEARDPSE